MESLETIEMDGKTVTIYADENPMNPRDISYNENLDLMICFHRNYQLGDKHNYRATDFNNMNELEEQIVKDHKPIIIKRLYLYDHSGITISTTPFHCQWDSGVVGFVLISKEQALKNWGFSKYTNNRYLIGRVNKYIEASVKEYDQYLTNEVYGYIVSDKDGNELDSCWGFYGWDYAVEQAKEALKNCEIPIVEDPNQLQLELN